MRKRLKEIFTIKFIPVFVRLLYAKLRVDACNINFRYNWGSLNKLALCPLEQKLAQVFNFLGNLVASVVTSLER